MSILGVGRVRRGFLPPRVLLRAMGRHRSGCCSPRPEVAGQRASSLLFSCRGAVATATAPKSWGAALVEPVIHLL